MKRHQSGLRIALQKERHAGFVVRTDERWTETQRGARRAVALDPTSAIRLNDLGWILHMDARTAEAVPHLELAIL